LADIFVSYSRQNKARVAPHVRALEAEGWSVWWDPEITPGQEFDTLISRELDQARALVVVWTPDSVDSRWVRGEARDAADRGVLVPVRFDNARLPIDFRAPHTTDLDDWAEDSSRPAFRSLCKALESKLGPVCAKMGKERLEWLKSDPGLDPIRDDERFKTMIATAERRLAASNS
jgi:adenylate cyclase